MSGNHIIGKWVSNASPSPKLIPRSLFMMTGLILLLAFTPAMLFTACGSEPQLRPGAESPTELSVSVATAVAEAEATVSAAQRQLPTVEPSELIQGDCKSLCDDFFWLFHAPTAYDVKMQLDQGADITARSDGKGNEGAAVRGWTPLHMAAAWSADPAIIALLLDSGADVNAKTEDGMTPLDTAARYSDEPAIIAMLLEAGADIDTKTNDGWTALHRAAVNPNGAVAALLLEGGADINAKTNDGWTSLHWAAMNPNGAVAALLLEHGADIEALNDDGKTACQYSREEIINLMCEP